MKIATIIMALIITTVFTKNMWFFILNETILKFRLTTFLIKIQVWNISSALKTKMMLKLPKNHKIRVCSEEIL